MFTAHDQLTIQEPVSCRLEYMTTIKGPVQQQKICVANHWSLFCSQTLIITSRACIFRPRGTSYSRYTKGYAVYQKIPYYNGALAPFPLIGGLARDHHWGHDRVIKVSSSYRFVSAENMHEEMWKVFRTLIRVVWKSGALRCNSSAILTWMLPFGSFLSFFFLSFSHFLILWKLLLIRYKSVR